MIRLIRSLTYTSLTNGSEREIFGNIWNLSVPLSNKINTTFQIQIDHSHHTENQFEACADPEREGGVGVPDRNLLKDHKNIGFLGNTGPDPLKNDKTTIATFNVGPSWARQRNAI